MDPFNPGMPPQQAPQVPQPKKPKKPDPAARRMKALDYVSLLLQVEPPPPDANLPPPIGYRFPDVQPEPMSSIPPMTQPPPSYHPPRGMETPMPEQYKQHVMRMRAKLGY